MDRRLQTLSLLVLVYPGTVLAATLEPQTVTAWEDYIQSAQARIHQRLGAAGPFLWVDEAPDRLAKVRAGEVVVSPVGPKSPFKVPSGLVHDWMGAVFIPNTTLRQVLTMVSDYDRYTQFYQPTVVESKAIKVSPSQDRFSVVLMNKAFFLKTALAVEYESNYVQLNHRKGYSISRSRSMREVEDYGLPSEHMLPEGQGRGITWRAFSVTRYLERDGGVYLEIEMIALSRDIPGSVRWLIEPIVRRVSARSIATSLRQTEEAVSASVRSTAPQTR